MDLIQAHDRDVRVRGLRDTIAAGVMFVGTSVLGVGLLTSPTQTVQAAAKPDPRVSQLQRENANQDAELRFLRRVLAVREDSKPVGPSTVPYVQPAQRDNDDNSDNPRVVVVRETKTNKTNTDTPKPTPTPGPSPRQTQPTNNVKKTTDTVKHAVENVIDTANKATANNHKSNRHGNRK